MHQGSIFQSIIIQSDTSDSVLVVVEVQCGDGLGREDLARDAGELVVPRRQR